LATPWARPRPKTQVVPRVVWRISAPQWFAKNPVVLDFFPTPSPLLFGCLAPPYQRPENAENRPHGPVVVFSLARAAPSKKRAGGGRGIRAPEGLHLSGFQDHRHRPLGHPSGDQQMIRSMSTLGPRTYACPDSR